MHVEGKQSAGLGERRRKDCISFRVCAIQSGMSANRRVGEGLRMGDWRRKGEDQKTNY